MKLNPFILCFPIRQRPEHRQFLSDPLRPDAVELKPSEELERAGVMAVELMQRIQDMQFAAAKNVERIKLFSRTNFV